MKKTLSVLALLAASQVFCATAFAQEIAITCNEGRSNEISFTSGYPSFEDWQLDTANPYKNYNDSNSRFVGGRDAKSFVVVGQDGNRFEYKILGNEPYILCEGADLTISKSGAASQHLRCGCDVD